MSAAFFSDPAAAPSVYAFAHFCAQFYLQLLIPKHLFPVFDQQTGVHTVKQQETVIVALYPSVPINAFYSKKIGYQMSSHLIPVGVFVGQRRALKIVGIFVGGGVFVRKHDRHFRADAADAVDVEGPVVEGDDLVGDG